MQGAPVSLGAPDDLGEQAVRFGFQGADVGGDLREGPQGLGFVEVAGEADLVPDLDAARVDPGVLIHVRDNGPGIPAEERENVFRRLYRLDASRTTPGSGLGLSLVKAVADLHGAAITLEDRDPGLGVTVSFPAVTPA